MEKQNTGNYYRTSERNVQLLISENFAEKEIPADDSVRLLEKTVEEMDLSNLYGAYNRRGRKAANDPATMLKILLYANMEGMYSSRDIERACKRDIEELGNMLERKEKYEDYQGIFNGRNGFSKTDPDATFMHMKEDHMRNSQLKPGYNIQFGVDGEYITGVSVSSERSDQLCLIPLLEDMKKNGIVYKDVTCDAGYESEENYTRIVLL